MTFLWLNPIYFFWLIPGLLLIGISFFRSQDKTSSGLVLAAIRLLAVLILIAAMAVPVMQDSESKEASYVVAIDSSKSVSSKLESALVEKFNSDFSGDFTFVNFAENTSILSDTLSFKKDTGLSLIHISEPTRPY